jgi:hypothetical protein
MRINIAVAYVDIQAEEGNPNFEPMRQLRSIITIGGGK